MIKTILSGHTSKDTAYLVNDYPYGGLRCKIRFWLETNDKKGTRFWSQTTNPRASTEVWNKPKYSTYADISGAMYLDEKDHVQWTTAHSYKDIKELQEFEQTFGTAATNHVQLKRIIRLKIFFEEELAKFDTLPRYGEQNYKVAYLKASKRCQDVEQYLVDVGHKPA